MAIVGISRDSVASHEKFVAKEKLPFALLADSEEKVCRLFDALSRRNPSTDANTWASRRSTFLGWTRRASPRREWRKVKVNGHVEEVLEAAKSLPDQKSSQSAPPKR